MEGKNARGTLIRAATFRRKIPRFARTASNFLLPARH
jgi:hypothetical protein